MRTSVICVGGPRDGWEGYIWHGGKITFPSEPVAEYDITELRDAVGRRIATPSGASKSRSPAPVTGVT